MKQSLEKQPRNKQGTNKKTLTSLELIPAENTSISGKSPGVPMVEVATPKGTNNLTEGTKKNELEVKERSLSK